VNSSSQRQPPRTYSVSSHCVRLFLAPISRRNQSHRPIQLLFSSWPFFIQLCLVFTTRRYASAVYAVVACLSVTSRYCIETTGRAYSTHPDPLARREGACCPFPRTLPRPHIALRASGSSFLGLVLQSRRLARPQSLTNMTPLAVFYSNYFLLVNTNLDLELHLHIAAVKTFALIVDALHERNRRRLKTARNGRLRCISDAGDDRNSKRIFRFSLI